MSHTPKTISFKGNLYRLAATVPQLMEEASHLLQSVDKWNKQIDPTRADPDKVRRALESAKTLVEIYTSMQSELGTPQAKAAMNEQPPKVVTYKGIKYQLRDAQPAAGDAVPISDEQPRDKSENSKVQQALKDSRKLYHEYKGKDPSLKETGINPDDGGDFAGALGGDGGAGVGDGGGNGGNGGNGGG